MLYKIVFREYRFVMTKTAAVVEILCHVSSSSKKKFLSFLLVGLFAP
jgi:hypothetical protein